MRLGEFPDVSVQPGRLVPVDPIKGKTAIPKGISIGVGGPLVFSYPPEDEDDSALRAYMQADTEWDYFCLRLKCTFDASKGKPFTEALVRYNLSRADGSSERAPMGWNAIPERATSDEGTLTTTTSLPAKAAVNGIEVGVEVARELEKKREGVCALAFGLLGSTPRWRLWETPSLPLLGDRDLALVVRAPRVPVIADLEVLATVRQRHGGVIPYRLELPPEHARVMVG